MTDRVENAVMAEMLSRENVTRWDAGAAIAVAAACMARGLTVEQTEEVADVIMLRRAWIPSSPVVAYRQLDEAIRSVRPTA